MRQSDAGVGRGSRAMRSGAGPNDWPRTWASYLFPLLTVCTVACAPAKDRGAQGGPKAARTVTRGDGTLAAPQRCVLTSQGAATPAALLRSKGIVALAKGDFEGAREAFREVIPLSPVDRATVVFEQLNEARIKARQTAAYEALHSVEPG